MNPSKASVYAPQAPDARTLADPYLSITSPSFGGLIITYCPRTHAGGFWSHEQRKWTFIHPVTYLELFEALRQQGVSLPGGDIVRQWVERIETVARECRPGQLDG